MYIYCIQDYEEDEMMMTLIEHIEKDEKKGKELQYFNVLFSFLSNVINYSNNIEFPLIPKQDIPLCYNVNCIQSYSDIPSPPPRITV